MHAPPRILCELFVITGGTQGVSLIVFFALQPIEALINESQLDVANHVGRSERKSPDPCAD